MIDEREREIWVGENRIYIGEDNILNFINIGEIDENIALESTEAMRKLKSMVEGNVDFIIDLNKGKKTTPKARRTLREFTENEVKGKIAFVGIHPVSRVLASFFMGITRKKDMRFFKAKEEAIAWLKEEDRVLSEGVMK